jgi:hypothetical protein
MEHDMWTATMFTDCADAEAVVTLGGHAVPWHLHSSCFLNAEALDPVFRAYLLPFQPVDEGGLRRWLGRLPGQEDRVLLALEHLSHHRGSWRIVLDA